MKVGDLIQIVGAAGLGPSGMGIITDTSPSVEDLRGKVYEPREHCEIIVDGSVIILHKDYVKEIKT
jgi:hypothetical protein